MNPIVDPVKEEKFVFSPNTTYEFTINPDDKHQYVNKQDTRPRQIKETIESIFETFTSDTKYHLFPEVSMPQYGNSGKNRISRYHYHGVITFGSADAVVKFLLNKWHKLTSFASIQFNPYRPDHWDAYCRKQQHLFPRHLRIKNALWKTVCKSA